MALPNTYLNRSVRFEARKNLFMLWKLQEEELRRKPDISEFYPINLEKLIKLLGWKIELVTSLGYTSSGYVVRGRCVPDKKVIQIDTEHTSTAERQFTIAHEVGHAVLHKNSPSCYEGTSLRQRSYRRKNVQNLDPTIKKLEREAEVFALELLMPEKAVRIQLHTVLSAVEGLTNRERVWSGSSFAARICRDRRSGEHRDYNVLSPETVAFHMAGFKPSLDVRSLVEMFGTSAAAMSRRLTELGLVY